MVDSAYEEHGLNGSVSDTDEWGVWMTAGLDTTSGVAATCPSNADTT